MSAYTYDLGVIGGGTAGLTVTAGAARLGVKTILIEREPTLGGDCLHYGCVPSKTLIRTASVYNLMRRAPEFGLPPAHLEPVDFRRVVARIRSVIAEIQHHDSPERFCQLGAKIQFGHAAFRSPHIVDVGGKAVSARNWVVATGSRASVPPIPGLAETPFLTNREIFYLDKLPSSLVILGGGYEAVELAQAFARLGSKVTVIQRSGQILSREDPDMAGELADRLRGEGVDIRVDVRVESVRDLGSEREIVCVQAGETVILRAETLLVALGRAANTEGLGLEDMGVEIGRKGIVVDERLRTARKHIYAAGDVAGDPMFTHAAAYDGSIVIANTVFHLPRRRDYTLMPSCVYTDPELASIGLNEKRAQERGIEHTVHVAEFKANDRALAEGEGRGRIKLLLNRKEHPIGVQILGPHAGELLGEWVAALNGKVGLSTLAQAVHPYPTLGEITKAVAGDVVGRKLFSGTVRKGLGLIFQYKGRACGND